MCAKSQVAQRDGHYKFKGWDNEGIPTKKTLKELDLGYVAEDLEQRGIITKKIEDVETGLESMVDKCWLQKVMDAFPRMAEKG